MDKIVFTEVKTKDYPFNVRFLILNRDEEIVAVARRKIGADAIIKTFNKKFEFHGPYSVIDTEEF